MNNLLESFKIIGLHGHKKLNVQIKDNTLILVGENGSGKTTFLRILFHFLSGRWQSLAQFKFEQIVATIGGKEYKINNEELSKAYNGIDRRLLSRLPQPIKHKILDLIERGQIERANAELSIFGERFLIEPDLFTQELDYLEKSRKTLKKEHQALITKIQDSIHAQILYLPTYRRIERELNSIFEGVDPDNFKRQRNQFHQNETGDTFIELVEFGMKDVERAVFRTLEKIKDFARQNLNNLTLRYLGDVVNREYQNVGMKDLANVSEDTVQAILNRIDDRILTKSHKDKLIGVINSARSAEEPTEHEKILYHYFLKLLEFQESLQQMELQISAFCELCSEYIMDKKFIYDSSSFTFSINHNTFFDTSKAITLSDLSSGEKQIVSLFSHLYLSGEQNFFVLIDEPELSLSVPWQKKFLADIRKGKFCKGLVAVTHSPFIYENELKPYAHSIGEFVIN